jgi:hypothetical protein
MKSVLNKIKDNFTKAEFNVAPNKKIKSIQSDFKDAFGLSLVFYKGKKIAESDMTLAALAQKTAKEITTKDAENLKLKASMKVKAAEELFDEYFGITVQVKDPSGTQLIPDEQTLGDAARSFKV